ncbi:MAG TPA: ParB/RepB/Spo0J family partition protein [Candidatus Sulfotelmatobacter sp.]|nr:ParB/RepB/Spo0J family partition protein [Candidatus Sulfotelmatobacter sp.]
MTAAGNLAGHSDKDKDKEKDKTGMRRALGRGLASLLPGPRVVPPAAPASAAGAPASSAASTATPPAPVAPRVAASPATAHVVPSHAPHPSGPTSGSQLSQSAGASSVAHAAPTQVSPVEPPIEIQAVADEEGEAAYLRSIAAESTSAETTSDSAGDGPIELMAAADTGSSSAAAIAHERQTGVSVIALAIRDIDRNPFQTRLVEHDDALEDLANSIKAQGVVQPIVVRPSEEEGRYTLILGERRLHASKKAGLTHVPAIVRRVSPQQAAEMTIIENLQREDLSPMEQAEAFRVLSLQFKMTQEQIGTRVGLSRASIANYMRLLKLPREVMQMLMEKRLNFAQAKELLKLEDNDRIAEAALYAVKKGMNIEQVEMLVLRMEGLLDPLPDMPGAKKKEEQTGGARWVDPNVRAAQVDLERLLGVRVRIRDRKGKGKIVIEYSTVDDYERVVGMIRGKK